MAELTKYEQRLIDRLDLATAAHCFAQACMASRCHAQIACKALDEYGDYGLQVSGVIRDHFPDDVKKALRNLCANINELLADAHRAKPARVQRHTIVKLGRAIAKRDGSGFYGPLS